MSLLDRVQIADIFPEIKDGEVIGWNIFPYAQQNQTSSSIFSSGVYIYNNNVSVIYGNGKNDAMITDYELKEGIFEKNERFFWKVLRAFQKKNIVTNDSNELEMKFSNFYDRKEIEISQAPDFFYNHISEYNPVFKKGFFIEKESFQEQEMDEFFNDRTTNNVQTLEAYL